MVFILLVVVGIFIWRVVVGGVYFACCSWDILWASCSWDVYFACCGWNCYFACSGLIVVRSWLEALFLQPSSTALDVSVACRSRWCLFGLL